MLDKKKSLLCGGVVGCHHKYLAKNNSVMKGNFFLRFCSYSAGLRFLELYFTLLHFSSIRKQGIYAVLRKSANGTRKQTGQLADLLHPLQVSHSTILHIAPTYPQWSFILSSCIIPSVIFLMTLYVLYDLPISSALILVTLRFQIRVARQL